MQKLLYISEEKQPDNVENNPDNTTIDTVIEEKILNNSNELTVKPVVKDEIPTTETNISLKPLIEEEVKKNRNELPAKPIVQDELPITEIDLPVEPLIEEEVKKNRNELPAKPIVQDELPVTKIDLPVEPLIEEEVKKNNELPAEPIVQDELPITEMDVPVEPVIKEKISKNSNKLPAETIVQDEIPTIKIDIPVEPEKFFYLEFNSQDSSQTIASSILKNTVHNRFNDLNRLIWHLIFEDKLGLAFHLTHILELHYPKQKVYTPSWLIRSIAIGKYIRYESGAIANLLKEDFSNFDEKSCFIEGNKDWNHAIRFLLVSATLCPALLTPSAGSSEILRTLRLKEGLGKLYEYFTFIKIYGDKLQALDVNSLKKVKDQVAWRSEMDSLISRVKYWKSQAPHYNIISVPGRKVWLYWLKEKELIHNLLCYITKDDLSIIEKAKRDIQKYSDQSVIKKLIYETHREILNISSGSDIVTKGQNQLFKHVSEAIGFLREWVELQETRPNRKKGFIQEQAEKLREDIFSLHNMVLAELEVFKKNYNSFLIQASISCCKKTLEKVYDLFDPKVIIPQEEINPKYLLNLDFLKIPSLILKENWEPENYNHEILLNYILDLINSEVQNWEDIFNIHAENRNHDTTKYIIEYLEQNEKALVNSDLDQIRQLREKRVQECREALTTDINATRKIIEDALIDGLLPESERLELSGIIESIELNISEILRFFDIHRKLKVIKEKIEQKRQSEIERIKNKLKETDIKNHPAYARILKVVEKGDVLTANEYIQLISTGQTLPQEYDLTSSFQDFFPDKCVSIENFFCKDHPERPSVRQIIKYIGNGKSIGPISLKKVPGAQANNASNMLEAWFTAKRTTEENIEKEIACILNHIGFTTLNVFRIKLAHKLWFEAITEVIYDKNQCPVSRYGSEAKGIYHILCVRDRPPEEDLLNDVGEMYSKKAPVIVFYFGHMTEKRRRDLARLCRERRRTFIVIDETLILYLCGERGARLPVLFGCSLPFTFLEPYIDTAGIVPHEMFYGRKKEKDSIIDPMGSCFIYGGRQLGKTALLRHVERSFHNPKDGQIALWIDLKVELADTIEDIWRVLIDKLKEAEVLPSELLRHTKETKLLDLIREWLDLNPHRRILLLLDESDKFLEADAKKDFLHVSRLKGLMDQTGRRFKVVFAGLHNVQRTTRQVNHPLAHFGEPLCIGPLLKNGEFREAQALIKKPLESIGYYFESSDPIMRILSQTNYYPSLIQLYCKHLLRYITESSAGLFKPYECPPYKITSDDVENAYKSQELRKAIRDKFMLTLDLDPRYKIIALAIAYHSISENGNKLETCFPLTEIREEAITWWPDGFQDCIAIDSFRVLLDEMIGLGILKINTDGKYSLRSPNVITLLGTKEEIEDKLLNQNLEAPLEYEPAIFRSAYKYSEKIDLFRRNPLTAQQESKLKSSQYGVSIIFGSEASGLLELEDFFKANFGNKFFKKPLNIIDKTTFTKYLLDMDERQKYGTTLIMISHEYPWSESWVYGALEKINRLKSKDAFLQIVFIADPNKIWSLVRDLSEFNTLISRGVNIINLVPWHDLAFRQWLSDCNISQSDKETRYKIFKVIGNWPVLLQHFYNKIKSDKHLWEKELEGLNKSLDDPEFCKELIPKFGLDNSQGSKLLRTWVDMDVEEISKEDLKTLAENIPDYVIEQTLRWAEQLSLIRPVKINCWKIDPIVKRILSICRCKV